MHASTLAFLILSMRILIEASFVDGRIAFGYRKSSWNSGSLPRASDYDHLFRDSEELSKLPARHIHNNLTIVHGLPS